MKASRGQSSKVDLTDVAQWENFAGSHPLLGLCHISPIFLLSIFRNKNSRTRNLEFYFQLPRRSKPKQLKNSVFASHASLRRKVTIDDDFPNLFLTYAQKSSAISFRYLIAFFVESLGQTWHNTCSSIVCPPPFAFF